MLSSMPITRNRVTTQIFWASLLLGFCLVSALAACLWWAAGRIDARAIAEERMTIEAALRQEMERIPVEQNSSAVWDDAVVNIRNNNQGWIAENLAEWMSEFFGHNRVYVISSEGRVIRAAEDGAYAGTTYMPIDVSVLLPRLTQLRRQMAEASLGLEDSTAVIADLGVLEADRLSDGSVVFVSIRPVVPSSSNVLQAPGSEALIASVKLVDVPMLTEISERFGIKNLHQVHYTKDEAAFRIRDGLGHAIASLTWTPARPAAALLVETAPATVGLLLVGLTSVVALLIWLLTTSLKLEKSREQTAYFALHDPLTGAANRILFDRKLREAMNYEFLARAQILLVSIDLDHFKEINDALGHAAGDQLLKEVAQRLMFELPEEATVGRLGGDEFAVVQPGIISEGQALWICQRLLNALEKPFQIDDSPVVVTFSLGVALEDGTSVSHVEILRRADVALYAAKAEGRDRFKLYNESMDQSRREKRALEIELRNALLNKQEFYLQYQPIFAARSGKIAGVEALVRWQHPIRGAMPPDQFISLAEETGLIDQLGHWVMGEACRMAVASELPWVAVNVSPIQFRDPQLADKILEILVQSGLAADRLEIEITEGVLLQNSPIVQQTLARLREAGVRVALDDFGTGYSSISYLRAYAVDKLKIDQSFTQLVIEDHAIARIVRSIAEMAEALGMSVTAEGIEDEAQRRTLANLGCTHLQGYLLSRPLTGTQLTALLAEHHSGALVRLFARD